VDPVAVGDAVAAGECAALGGQSTVGAALRPAVASKAMVEAPIVVSTVGGVDVASAAVKIVRMRKEFVDDKFCKKLHIASSLSI
jgi:alpha-D-ribose 1-methylphosphonate 5-triphosphate synthase subunit PhnL